MASKFPLEDYLESVRYRENKKDWGSALGQGLGQGLSQGMINVIESKRNLYNAIMKKFSDDVEIVKIDPSKPETYIPITPQEYQSVASMYASGQIDKVPENIRFINKRMQTNIIYPSADTMKAQGLELTGMVGNRPTYARPQQEPSFTEKTEQARMMAQAKAQGTAEGSVIKNKTKDTQNLFQTISKANDARAKINEALVAADNVTPGLAGKARQLYSKNLNPNDPMLAEWQKIKMVLTDAQLMRTAQTKGAISDREMALFSDAVANDDLTSVPRIKVVLQNMLNTLNRDEQGVKQAYEASYGELPKEATATKYKIGQELNYGGKRYRIIGGDLNSDPDVEVIQ